MIVKIDYRHKQLRTIRRIIRQITVHLPPRNFITLHYVYFVGTCLAASLIFWGSSVPPKRVPYSDSLFLVVSAMTLAGLNTVSLSDLNTFQQSILFTLLLLGSAIFVSSVDLQVRKRACGRRFISIISNHHRHSQERHRRLTRRSSARQKTPQPAPAVDGVVLPGSAIKSPNQVGSEKDGTDEVNPGGDPPVGRKQWMKDGFLVEPDRSMNQTEQTSSALGRTHERDPSAEGDAVSRRITCAHPASPTMASQHTRAFSMQVVGARRNVMSDPCESSHLPYPRPSFSVAESNTDHVGPLGFLSPASFIGRNSQFSGLTLAERDRLGGVEYRAIKILALIVPLYFVLWQLLGSIGLGVFVARYHASTSLTNGLNPWYAFLTSYIRPSYSATD